MVQGLETLAPLLDRLSAPLGDGIHPSAIPRVALLRSAQRTDRLHVVYQPSVCFIAQGEKRTIAGDRIFDYGPGSYLAVSVDLPVVGEVMKASAKAPYLCLRLDLDPALLSGLVLDAGLNTRAGHGRGPGIARSEASAEMLGAAVRLLGLLERPQAIGVLAPLAERELLYWLLMGEQGELIRQVAFSESRIARISRAIAWIKTNFRESFRIEAVAEAAGMSPSVLHQHFKAITSMSPLQYQKQLRLQEARRVILAGQADAASAGFAVGYSSPSQFSREYARLFGAPPVKDVQRLRAGGYEQALTGVGA